MAKPDQIPDPASLQFMIVDFLGEILRFSANPVDMGQHLARMLRELIGVRIVAMLQHDEELSSGSARIVALEPAKAQSPSLLTDLVHIVENSSGLTGATLILRASASPSMASVMDRLELSSLSLTPLRVGELRVGTLVMLSYLDHEHQSGTSALLDALAPVFALVLRNAFHFEAQEAKVVAQAEEYRTLLRTNLDGYCLVSGLGAILETNEGYLRMSGYALGEIRDLHISQLEAVESPAEAAEHIERIKQRGSDRFLSAHRTKDGTVYPVEISTTHVPSRDVFITFIRDLTEKLGAEQALRNSEARFNTAFAFMPMPLTIVRLQDGGFLEVNQAFTELSGYSERELLGQTWVQMGIWMNPEDRAWVVAQIANGQPVVNYESRMRTKEGRVKWITFSGRQVQLGGESCLLAGFNDISERKQVEEEREQFFRFFQTSSDLMCLVDPQGVFTRVNPAWISALGYSAEELTSRPFIEFVVEEDRTATNARLSRLLAPGRTLKFENRYRGKDGSIRWLSWQATYAITEGIIYATARDVTDLKQAEDERNILQEKLVQAQKLEAIGALVAGVAHNINNALAAIMGTASVREVVTTEGKDLEAYRIIGEACRRGRDVVRSLVQFSRPSFSNAAPLELHALISEVRDLLASTTRNRIQILEAFATEPLWIQGNAGNLNHALMNLCLNALDAMPDGGTLTFRTAPVGTAWVEISLEDTGEGMTSEILKRVMEPFFTTKDVGKGTGLGLSMTHGVVKAHGGELEISSTPGQGTSVKLRFPRIPAPMAELIAEKSAPPSKPMNILLVDDDEDVRFLVARMFKHSGHEVKSAASGQAALQSLASGPLPDLVILDQNMPGLTGLQTLERIRALHPELPVLISSGQLDLEEWPSFQLPNVGFISKPFDMAELQAKLTGFTAKSGFSLLEP